MSLYSLNAFLIVIRFLAVLLLDGFSITRPLITRLRILGLLLGRQHIASLSLVKAFAGLRAVRLYAVA